MSDTLTEYRPLAGQLPYPSFPVPQWTPTRNSNSQSTFRNMGNTIRTLFPSNDASTYEGGHTMTPLAKMSWPFLQLALIFNIVSFSCPNWSDGEHRDLGDGYRLFAGAWRSCVSTAVNLTSRPDTLPVDACSDTAVFVVDGLKTGWVAAWRAFLTLSFLSLLITSVLLSCYVFGKRLMNHSSFPLFWSFTSGFASVVFTGLSLLIFAVQSQKAAELRGVAWGWAFKLSIASLAILIYSVVLILCEFIELNDYRARRKRNRRQSHMRVTHDHGFPPGVTTETRNVSPTVQSPRVRGSVNTTNVVGEETNVSAWRTQDSVPVPHVRFGGATGNDDSPPYSFGTVPEKKECPVHSHQQTTINTQEDIKKRQADIESSVKSGSADAAPPIGGQTNIDWTGMSGKAPDVDETVPEAEDRIRARRVTLRRHRRKSQVEPDAD